MLGLQILVQGRIPHPRIRVRSPHPARKHREALLMSPGTGYTASAAAAFEPAVTVLDRPWLRGADRVVLSRLP